LQRGERKGGGERGPEPGGDTPEGKVVLAKKKEPGPARRKEPGEWSPPRKNNAGGGGGALFGTKKKNAPCGLEHSGKGKEANSHPQAQVVLCKREEKTSAGQKKKNNHELTHCHLKNRAPGNGVGVQ